MNVIQQRKIYGLRQRGMSFVSVVLLAVALVSVAVIVAKSVPMFVEYAAVIRAVKRAADSGSVSGARESFGKSKTVDNINSITREDLIITNAGDGKITVEFNYEREIKLYGPAHLVYRFNGSATTK